MQNAYATSKDALRLLAEAETLMGQIRSGDDALPQSGASSEMRLRGASSLNALATPRQCALHVGEDRLNLTITPRSGLSAEGAVEEAISIGHPPADAGNGPVSIKKPDSSQKT